MVNQGDEGMVGKVEALGETLPCQVQILDVDGHGAFLFLPMSPARLDPTPWVWYAPTFIGGNPSVENGWMFERFLRAGIAVAGVEVGESYGNPAGRAIYTALFETLVHDHGLASKAALMPQSRGGLMLYNWAAEHAEQVACVAGIYTVCDINSYPGTKIACEAYSMSADELAAHLAEHNPIDRLLPLADAGVPIMHVHGDGDGAVPIERNSDELMRRYTDLGGKMDVIVIAGKGHEVAPEFFECQEMVDFVLGNVM
jgi:hypothetical protein